MINYSFIIPHKNCPDLLNRCVGSIPERDDVQIIVVDDNSDKDKKPELSGRKGLEVVLLDSTQSNGAGRARNMGLKQAKGKWLLFADCDDYYAEGFMNTLDQYTNEKIDVLYFNAQYYNAAGKEIKRMSRINQIFSDYDGSKYSIDLVKFRFHAPWNKMIRKSFVDKYGFQFEEVPTGNDTMFTYQVGYFANDIKVIQNKLYSYTLNAASITHKRKNIATYVAYYINVYKNMAFYTYIGHKEWSNEIEFKRHVLNLLKKMKLRTAISVLYVNLRFTSRLKESSRKYIDLIESLKQ